MDAAKELFALFAQENCDYDRCRQLIREIGGCTQIVEGAYGEKTTSLHEAIESYRLYDFALELIGEAQADLDVDPDGWGTVLWGLQYLDSETEEEQWAESEYKLRLMRALIRAGANPNPVGDSGEDFVHWIRFRVGEWEGTYPENFHLWQIEHMIEAHTLGETERFFAKLSEQSVRQILLSDWGFRLLDDNLCDSDHAVFLFEDGERMMLSSYQTDDDEWNFYAVPLDEDQTLDKAKHHEILPLQGMIRLESRYSDTVCPTSHWLDLSIDDAILHIHADEPNITVAIGCRDEDDYESLWRTKLFQTPA